MANKPTPADFSPTVPDFPVIGQYQPIYGKFDLTTYIQGASDYEIMAFLVQCYNATLKGYSDVTQLSKDTVTAYNQLQTWVNTWFAELDVQQEINNKLQSMYEAGTLANAIAHSNTIPPAVAQYLNSTEGTQNLSNVTAQKIEAMSRDGSLGTVINNTGAVQTTTSNWLKENVTPTGSAVAVDKSLTIENAAADAKVTGQVRDDISEPYSAEKIYSSGDICIYNNKLYRRKSDAAAAEEWNSEHWLEISVGTQFKQVAAEIGNLESVSTKITNRYNLFDKNDTYNTIYAYTGTSTGNISPSNLTRSIVVKCEPLTKYTVSRAFGNYTRFGIVSVNHYPSTTDTGDFIANIQDSHTQKLPLQSNGARDWYTFTTNSSAKYLIVSYYNAIHDTVSDNELRDSICISVGENHKYYAYDFIEVKIKDTMLSETMQQLPQRVEGLENSPTANGSGFIPYLKTRVLRLSDNLFVSSSVIAGNGWTINENAIAHSANGTEDLVIPIDGKVGDKYIVEFDSSFYQEEFVTVGTDEKNLSFVYNGTSHIVIPVEIISKAEIIVRPYNNKQFELSNISIRKIQSSGTEYNLNYISAVTTNNRENYGNRNVLIGYDSATHAIGSTRLVAIGNAVLKNLLAGHRNIGIGGSALQNLEKGDENIAIGADAGIYIITGVSNIAVGVGACAYGRQVDYNIALGKFALSGVPGGESKDCVALGRMAGYQNQGNNNIYIGHTAGYSNKTGNNNVFVGADTTYSSTGDYNVFLGSGAYATAAGARDSIGIGHAARPSKSNQMVLGSAMVTEVVFCGNKKINFNTDGTVTWEEI